MFTPKDLNKTIILNGYTFHVYSIEDFDFNCGLDVTIKHGLYCFTERIKTEITKLNHLNTFVYHHNLLYLGKAEGTYGIEQRLQSNHNKYKLLKNNANCVCLCTCDSNVDVKSIESEILNLFSFKYNEAENNNKMNKETVN